MKKYLLIFVLIGLAVLLLAQKTVNIIIRANVSGAIVFLDNKKVGITDASGRKMVRAISEGRHTVRIEKSGFEPISSTIEVKELKVFFDFNLKKLPGARNQTGKNIVIRTNVPGAEIFFDNQKKGKTGSDGNKIIEAVSLGKHQVRVVKTGYLPASLTIDVDELTVIFNLPLSKEKSRVQEKAPVKAEPFPLQSKPEEASDKPRVKLIVRSNIPGAQIMINGVLKGETRYGPRVLMVSAGKNHIKVMRNGYEDFSKIMTIEAGLDASLNIEMTKSLTPETEVRSKEESDRDSALDIVVVIIFLALGGVIAIMVKVIRSSKTLGKMGTFELIKIIGKGGIATVYKAKDLKQKKIIALKVMDFALIRDADLVFKFFKEGEVISRINEEYPEAPVVRVMDYGRDKEKSLGVPFIAMELLKGPDMLYMVKREKKLELNRKIFIVKEVARALQAAHALKIYHGDITLDNMIMDKNKVKLIDFGVALQEHENYKTLDASITGKPIYMSPEQCKGGKINSKSDIYSLGVVMFILFFDKPPFIAKSPHDIMKMHESDPVPIIQSDISPELHKLIIDMLNKNPQERPAADEVIEKLDQLLKTPFSATSNVTDG